MLKANIAAEQLIISEGEEKGCFTKIAGEKRKQIIDNLRIWTVGGDY